MCQMKSPPLQSMTHLKSLQSLRGVAVLMVLVFHIASVQRQQVAADAFAELKILSGVWDRGYMGVDLFFVISGFVMVYVTRNVAQTPKDIGRFLYARITRIYPLWWVFAGLAIAYYLLMYGQPVDPLRVAGANDTIPYLTKSFLLLPQEQLPVLLVGWTLIHEMYFYIVFAAILFLPKRFLPYALMFWAVATVCAFWAGWVHTTANNMASLVGSLLSLEFIVGGIAAWFITRGVIKHAKLCAVLGVVFIGLGCVFYTRTDVVLTLWGRVAVFAIPCALLTYGLSGLEIVGKLKPSNWIVTIGDWSYSLYLSHIFVLSGIADVLPKLYPYLPDFVEMTLKIGAPGILDNLLMAMVGLVGCIVFAGLSYRFIERPLIRVFRKMQKIKFVRT